MTDLASAPPGGAAVRPLYWSLRRELWEHRSLYVGPMAVAAVVLVGFLLSTLRLPQAMREVEAGGGALISTPYSFLAMALILTGFLVSALYCLSALHGERRDRSVLFWKSLPVSDLVTVAAKALIPLVAVPLVVIAVALFAHLVMALVSTVVVVANGQNLSALWTRLPVPQVWLTLVYGVITNTLWQAPIFAWLLLVSSWAKRTPLLWAVGPPIGLCIVEGMAFDGAPIRNLLQDRLTGGPGHAFEPGGGDRLLSIAPLKFLSTPGLWLGLAFAAAFLAAAVWQRRRREPI